MDTGCDFLITGLLSPSVLTLSPGWDKEVKGCFKDFLGVVGEINEAIPSSRPQSTGGVVEALVGEAHGKILGIDQGALIYFVRLGIILNIVILNTSPEAVNILQIGLHIRLPLAFRPRGT